MAILKADILGADDGALDAAGRSTQIPEDARDYEHGLAKEPPHNVDALAQFLEINTYHMRCCKTKAIVTSGLGYEFVSPKFEHGYKRLLGRRPTPVGEKFLIAEARAAYAGIPLVRAPIIPSNLSEGIGGAVHDQLTFVILTPRKNPIASIHRKMTLEGDRNIFARMRQYAFTSRVAAAVEETDAMAIAEQVSVGS